MNINRSTTLRFVKTIITTIIVIVILSYAVSGSLNYFRGPEILIFEPKNGSSIASSTILLKGQAKRINTILLNGSPVLIDEQGDFEKKLALFKGLNILTLIAGDQFGRKTENEIKIFGTVDLPKALNKKNVSTSTIATSTIP